MKVDLKLLKRLRQQTGAGVMDCRQALLKGEGDKKKALEWLQEKGAKSANKRAGREVKTGILQSYLHGEGQILAVVELLCETDFVARNDDFKKLALELAMQVAAMKPGSVDELLAQSYIREESKQIADLVKETIAKIGENIVVRRVARFEVGEKLNGK
ncbi:translation elongation factor Ts [Patescibacteria group bacterium]